MARTRRNDPEGVSDTPVTTNDLARCNELVAEFLCRLECIVDNYKFWRNCLGKEVSLNSSLDRFERAAKQKRPSRRKLTRLNPMLEGALSARADSEARDRSGADDPQVACGDLNVAAKWVLENVKPVRGRPDDEVLRHHVEGLMALVQEMSGKPVLAARDRNSVYDPHLGEGVSQIIALVFRDIDPSISETTLVNLVLEARRKYAGQRMRFVDFFPHYGAGVGQDEGITLGSGLAFEVVGTNIPIYCP